MDAGEIVDLFGRVEASTDEIRRPLPADPGFETVAYHLAVLEDAGLLDRSAKGFVSDRITTLSADKAALCVAGRRISR